jgi:hypothetical protein
MLDPISPPRKVSFLKWDADIPIGRVVYTVQAYTKQGAVKKAMKFLKENS